MTMLTYVFLKFCKKACVTSGFNYIKTICEGSMQSGPGDELCTFLNMCQLITLSHTHQCYIANNLSIILIVKLQVRHSL